jgi:hypothetical protein
MTNRHKEPPHPPKTDDGWNESRIVRRLPDGSHIDLDQWIDQRVAAITKNLGGRPQRREFETWQAHVVQYYARELAAGGVIPSEGDIRKLLRETAADMVEDGGMARAPKNKTVSDYAKRILAALKADSERYG